MKHAVKGKQLNRNSSQRRSLFKNLMVSLIAHGKIKTTQAKAKAVQAAFEKLITKAKRNTVHSRRLIDKHLNRRQTVNKLVDEIAPVIKRAGGYTRITKIGQRRGDAAEMVMLEIIDYKPEVKEIKKTQDKKGVKKTAKETKKAESKKSNKPTIPSTLETAVASKHSRVTEAATQAKHIPQKRMSGDK
jgi:large subunit ribosomal protein L17